MFWIACRKAAHENTSFLGRAIARKTRSIYSHSEIVFQDGTAVIAEASILYKGVRIDKHNFDNEEFDYYEIICDDFDYEKAYEWLFSVVGERYDWLAVLMGIIKWPHYKWHIEDYYHCGGMVCKFLKAGKLDLFPYRNDFIVSPGMIANDFRTKRVKIREGI